MPRLESRFTIVLHGQHGGRNPLINRFLRFWGEITEIDGDAELASGPEAPGIGASPRRANTPAHP